MRVLFCLFGKDTFGSLARLLLEVLGHQCFDGEDIEVKQTVGRSGYVLEGFAPCLGYNDEEGYFIQYPDMGQRKLQRVFGMK